MTTLTDKFALVFDGEIKGVDSSVSGLTSRFAHLGIRYTGGAVRFDSAAIESKTRILYVDSELYREIRGTGTASMFWHEKDGVAHLGKS